jgi:hypothetical protein
MRLDLRKIGFDHRYPSWKKEVVAPLFKAMSGEGSDGVKFVQIYPFEKIIKEASN